MINAYEGIPGNGKPFPEGFMMIEEIEWSKKKNPVSPYFVEVPDTLKSVSFIAHEWMGDMPSFYMMPSRERSSITEMTAHSGRSSKCFSRMAENS
jgi:hypothetical protein